MTGNTVDPWGNGGLKSQGEIIDDVVAVIDQEKDQREYAPFALLSCKKVFNSQLMPRKNLHVVLYGIILLFLLLLTAISWALIMSDSSAVMKADIIMLCAELWIWAYIIKGFLSWKSKESFPGFPYFIHLLCNIVMIPAFWTLILAAPYFSILIHGEYDIEWLADDILLLIGVVSIVIFYRASRYVGREV